MGRRNPILALSVLALMVPLACMATGPTPSPSPMVYFRNLSGSALLVGVTSGSFNPQAVLRPCGGEASFAVPAPPTDDPRVLMSALYDSTGAFDALVAQLPAGSIDPQVLGNVSLTGIIWSRGDIGVNDLPRWITFRVGTTDVGSTAPTDTAPPDCDPWPPSE